MSASALAMVFAGAICHAIWNVAAKKAAGGLAFVWLFGLVSVVAAAPFAWWAWQVSPQGFSTAMWCAALGSAIVHVVYSLVLQRGYKVSNFSLVYPIARGTGPMLSVLAAVILLGEKPGAWGWVGVASVLAGVLVSTGTIPALLGRANQDLASGDKRLLYRGVLWGTLTGACIASYTVIDGWAIKTLGMQPMLFYTVGLVARTLVMTPFALRKPVDLRQQWNINLKAIVLVGVLSPLAYTLVLFAVQRAPLSYVAPVREISMLIGTFLGAKLLREAVRPSQWMGAALMLTGVMVLAIA
jgi:drug/metabolite transporter (DMT)-like permease